MEKEIDMGCKRSREEFIMGGDLLFEVLIRLPVKVLFRFKVVSKQWYSMISEPSFARRYVARASPSPQWIFISCFARQPIVEQFFKKKLPSLDCSLGIHCLDLLTVPIIACVYELRNILVGVSNGLLLFGPAMENRRFYSYFMYNPLTGQGITLPPHQHYFESVTFTGFITQIKDTFLESFRVLRMYADYKGSHRSFRYEVYFSEICEWADYTAEFNQDINFERWENCVVIDKTLHWIVNGHYSGHVMAFDLYNKPDSARLIALPVGSIWEGEWDGEQNVEYILFNEQDHLRYLELFSEQGDMFYLRLWELTDYESGEWCLRHRAIFDNFRCDGERRVLLKPLSFHPFRPNIFYMVYRDYSSQYIMSYDIKSRELKTLDDTMYDSSKNDFSRIPGFLPFFLFVVPPWPVLVNLSNQKD